MVAEGVMKYKRRLASVQAIQINWENWEDIQLFVPSGQLGWSVYLNEASHKVLPTGIQSSVMGIVIRFPDNHTVVAEQDEWLLKDERGLVTICSQSAFDNLYEQEK